jgi:60 kDa SS-A/Ro ribonucleoprotein
MDSRIVTAYSRLGLSATKTPQSLPIPGRESEMTLNNAGGFGFVLDDWERLNRFLILGSEGGTYYVGENKMTAENAQAAIRCIQQDGVRAVKAAVEINLNNRAPKTDSQLYVLALAMKFGDQQTKNAVTAAAPSLLRTGTHVLHFVAMLDSLGGWNRSKRRVINNWFEKTPVADLAYQVLKYRNRDGWTMRDALRVTHPSTYEPERKALFDWTCGRTSDLNLLPDVIKAHVGMQTVLAAGAPLIEVAKNAIDSHIPREALPTEALADPAIWRALLPKTPLHALLRNLGTLTAKGVLSTTEEVDLVVNKLTDKAAIHKSKVHPFAVLLATLVYQSGAGFRGSQTWTPVPAVLSALEDAYDLAFANVTPTGKKILIGVDISGSMSMPCMGTPVPASLAASAMAITLARIEPHATVVQFDTAVQRIMPVTKRTGIASLASTSGGGTDTAAPILWALGRPPVSKYYRYSSYFAAPEPRNTLESAPQQFDAIVILTDNETWAGHLHASEALTDYRRTFGPTKLIAAALAANHASIVDPTDPLSMGCAGLDANLPSIVSEFIRGEAAAEGTHVSFDFVEAA